MRIGKKWLFIACGVLAACGSTTGNYDPAPKSPFIYKGNKWVRGALIATETGTKASLAHLVKCPKGYRAVGDIYIYTDFRLTIPVRSIQGVKLGCLRNDLRPADWGY